MAFCFRFHLVIRRSKDSKRAIASSSLPLSSDDAHRATSLPLDGVTSMPAASACFAQFVFQLADLFLHTHSVSSTSVTSCSRLLIRSVSFVFQLTPHAPDPLSLSAVPVRFFLPFNFTSRRLFNTASQLFFSASARAEVERTSTNVSSIPGSSDAPVSVDLPLSLTERYVGIHDVGKARKNTHNVVLLFLRSGLSC